MKTMLLSVLSLLFFVSAAVAADVESGPKPGEKITKLKVHSVVGAIEDKEVDYTEERKGKPTVYVFVQADLFSRPIARYMKELDKVVAALGKDTYVVAVWLTEDKDKTKAYLPLVNKSMKFEATSLTYSLDGKAGPDDWALNDRAHVTTVVVKDGKVIERFAYVSTNDTDVPKVEEVIKKAVEEKK
jgi:hypothetical protein